MSVKTDSQLKTELDTTFYTNGANLSTGALTNTHLTNTIDSKVSVVDAETINGVKTFGSFPVTPSSAPTTDYQVANKKYVDDNEVDGLWTEASSVLSPVTTSNSIKLESTESSTQGIIFKDTVPFIHDYHNPTGDGAVPHGNNVFIGNAGNFTMGSTATASTHSSDNIGIGSSSLVSNTLGHTNIAVGGMALTNNTEGSANMAIGDDALRSNTTGELNTAVGQASMFSNTEGLGNTAIGSNSLQNITTGNQNIGIGWTAGRYYGNGADANTTPTKSIYLGYNTRASANGQTNQIVIGPDAIGNGNNTATLGDDNLTDVYINEDGEATVHAGQYRLSALNTAPASAAAAGTLGEIRVDANHIYVCTATDTWKRTALTTW